MTDLSNLVKEATSRKMPEYDASKNDPNIIEPGAEPAAKEVEEKPAVKESPYGTLKVELVKSGFRTGQPVKGTITISMKEEKAGDSLIVALWGQKVVALPAHFRTSGGNNDSRVVRVSERYVELTGAKQFKGEEKFQFELPLAAPVPDLAANYKWYVGASLVLSNNAELADMVEIKVVD